MDMRVMVRAAMVAMVALVGCERRMDSVQLAEYVKGEMQRELVQKSLYQDLQVGQVTLVQKDDSNNYTGKAQGTIKDTPVTFDLTCVYDGKSVVWDSKLSGDSELALRAKLEGKELGAKLGKVFSGLKDGAKKVASTVADATGEYLDEAKDAAKSAAGATKSATEKAVTATGEALDGVKKAVSEKLGE